MPATQIRHRMPLLPDPQMGEWLSQLTATELKVLLYLTLQSQEANQAAIPGRPLTKAEFPLRKIANGTQLKKKEVRQALRLLSISATYYDRFQ